MSVASNKDTMGSYGIPSSFQNSMMLLKTIQGLICKINPIEDSYVSYLNVFSEWRKNNLHMSKVQEWDRSNK